MPFAAAVVAGPFVPQARHIVFGPLPKVFIASLAIFHRPKGIVSGLPKQIMEECLVGASRSPPHRVGCDRQVPGGPSWACPPRRRAAEPLLQLVLARELASVPSAPLRTVWLIGVHQGPPALVVLSLHISSKLRQDRCQS